MKYFNLFSNILITKGAMRILISDLQRNISELYPTELHDLIEELKTASVEGALEHYDQESRLVVQEYLDLLLEKEFGFLTQNDWDKNFPPLSQDYQEVSVISDIFVELHDLSVFDTLQHSIENLEIKHLVIFCPKTLMPEEFVEIDRIFSDSTLETIEIFSQFHNTVDLDFIQALDKSTSRIYSLVFYSCPETPFNVADDFRFTISFTDQPLKVSSCGKISLDYFNTNLPKVLESVNHNSCLHKKIGIDIGGNIKNCPAMPQTFGNIKDTTLEEALQHKDFKRYWNLTKDHIEVCKDCEFRYICTDCRAFTEQTHFDENRLDVSKPLKCGYNPYTAEWEEWSTNPLKQKAILYYGIPEHQ
ncbi:grasp-with-spasm system SPASM domain peptide maturase [uncultured Chryseobacterium sp.]|uniref:grasp-with-spasm system SPASM domain peptide maturase n=1 Tax=uncultured Chryseobacterium sp. TaxID=259322 RepID=UPI0025E905FB|nr:grasp-with-spasm system SPASM domain peptide maturase [uncultured Chryseobacterium sp.]